MAVPIPKAIRSLFTDEQWTGFTSSNIVELQRVKRLLDSDKLTLEQLRILRRILEYRWQQLEYEIARSEGDKRFGSVCEHAHVKNGYCLNCFRKVK